jgi:hypothetical protein
MQNHISILTQYSQKAREKSSKKQDKKVVKCNRLLAQFPRSGGEVRSRKA